MIIGDPLKFAFIIDVVPEWSDEAFKNGMFFISINGVLFPPLILNCTLNTDLYHFFEIRPSSLISFPVDSKLFEMEQEKLFYLFYESLNSDEYYYNEEINGTLGEIYKCSTMTMEDQGYYLFSVSNGQLTRIIGAKVKQLTSPLEKEIKFFFIVDAIFPTSDISSLVIQLREYYNLVLF